MNVQVKVNYGFKKIVINLKKNEINSIQKYIWTEMRYLSQ